MIRHMVRVTATMRSAGAAALLAIAVSFTAHTQTPIPSIADKTAGMEKIDGFFPLYWDADAGQLWMEINRFGTELLNITGMGAGLGSNDIGIDRGQLAGSSIVTFERVGPKVLMVEPNYRFRASSTRFISNSSRSG